MLTTAYPRTRYLSLVHTIDIHRLLIGPACLPLLTVVVLLPAAAAAMKHFLVPHAGPVY